jgi:uncharacterized lipoprotein YddW (UPF0748 family)
MKRTAWLLVTAAVFLLTLPGARADREDRSGTRAVWVTRWAFGSEEDLETLLAQLGEIGINTVFFQVRGSCDALYRSSYEPWSQLLTGQLGKDPGWDPLAVAVSEAHKRKIDLHAWINVFPAWHVTESGDPPPRTDPLHVVLEHPEWLACDASGKTMSLVKSETRHNYAFLSPTNEGAREHVKRVVKEMAANYGIDGLHLDYIRFPDSSYSYDPESRLAYIRYARDHDISFADWRKLRLTEFVGELSQVVKAVRPSIQVSAAVWQKIGDGRDRHFQDGIEWADAAYVDFLVPMIYTPKPEVFEARLAAYVDRVGAAGIVAGIGAYLDGFSDSVLAEEIKIADKQGLRGISVFNSDYAVQYSGVLKRHSGDHRPD